MKKTRISLCILVFAALLSPSASAAPRRIFVATNGNDAWSGRLDAPNRARSDGPFATLERARDEIRRLKTVETKSGKALPRDGVTVEIRGGLYQMPRAFDLSAPDSGTATSPIEYRARRGETVRLSGGKVVTGWKPVSDAQILARLDPAARGHVWQSDLRAQGLSHLPDIEGSAQWGESKPGVELFFGAAPMTLARWPNQGYSTVVDVVGGQPQINRDSTKADKTGVFQYEGDRPLRWKGESEVWMHGFWAWDWADQRQKVASIDTDKRIVTLEKPDHSFGYRVGQWYYAFNILAELDQPGEWYLDRASDTLYFWPPTALSAAQPLISLVPNLVTMQDVSYLTLRGLTLEAARGTAIAVQGGSHVTIGGCTIRNVGAWGVTMHDAAQGGVQSCDIYQTGEGGIDLRGGDRATLKPSGLFADNNHIHHFARWNPVYKPALRIRGVGIRLSHNLIHDAPHQAIDFGGNDHTIEFNEIHDVCQQTNDAGAIYGGADWTMRGNLIRFNFLHDITGRQGRGAVGVYLDDNFSSAQIFGNVFSHVSKAAFIGGGRDNSIENNVFLNCDTAVHQDGRGLGWRADGLADLTRKLQAMPFQTDPWRTRYPPLLTLLEDEPMAPKNNLIAHNIRVGGTWSDFDSESKPYLNLQNNWLDGDPLFVDAARGDFRLRADSSANKIGFVPIPTKKIGLYRDSWRGVDPRS